MEFKTYKDKFTTRNIVLALAQKNRQIIHGGQSTNIHLPYHLRRETTDFDIYTRRAKQEAEELANQLNREYGKNFTVEPAIHKGTFKVKDWEGHTVADYTTQKGRKPKTTNVLGVHYSNPDYAEYKLKKVVKNKDLSFRHEKDLDTIRRIKQYKKIKVW